MVSGPHVVIDVRMLRHAGIGTYIRNVVPRVIASRPAWHFTLLAPRGASTAFSVFTNATVVPCDSRIYSVAEQLELPMRAPSGADVFWSPHYNVPLGARARLVVTVHDVAHLALPEIHGGALRQLYARRMFAAVRRRARAIMFNSAFTEDEFARLVGATKKSTVIHLGVDESWSMPVDGPPPHARPYLLFVGSVKPHKNLLMLIRAFETLLGLIEHDLVIVGACHGQRTLDTPALALGASLGDRVRFVDGVEDAALKRYVTCATALVLPSLYEGFGLPALEAMAAGCPCIVSTAASLPEVCGDAALYCDPRDVGDIARCIYSMVTDAALRDRLVRAGRARAGQFDWNQTAARSAAVLERVMIGGAP